MAIKKKKSLENGECINNEVNSSNFKQIKNKNLHFLKPYGSFSEDIGLKPCYVRLSRVIGNKPVFEINHAVEDCPINQFVEEGNTSDSFISDSLLSTPSSLAESEINKETVRMDENVFVCNIPKSHTSKKIEKLDNIVSRCTPVKNKNLIHLESNSLKSTLNIMRVESDDDNSKKCSSRSKRVISSSSEISDTSETKTRLFGDHILKWHAKRKAILSSSNSSESLTDKKEIPDCSTVRNSDSFKRNKIFSKRKCKRRGNIPSKKSSHYAVYADSSSDSSSTVLNYNSANSKTRKLIADVNVARKDKPVLCEQNRNLLGVINNNGDKSFISKYRSLGVSDSENLCDNYYNSSNVNAHADKLKNESVKHSFKNRTDHNYLVVKPCYIKLEKISIPVKCHIQEFTENASIIKRLKNSECLNYHKGNTNTKNVSNKIVNFLQSDDVAADKRLSEFHDISDEEKMIKPCSVILRKWVDNKLVSDTNHVVDVFQNNQFGQQDLSESFISDSLLSSPSSLDDSDIKKKTLEFEESNFAYMSSKSDARSEIGSHISECREVENERLVNDESSTLNPNVSLETEESDDDHISTKNTIKRENLIPTSSKFYIDKEKTKSVKSIVKYCNRKTKLLSCSSSESDIDKVDNEKTKSVTRLVKYHNKRKKILSSSSSSESDIDKVDNEKTKSPKSLVKYCNKRTKKLFSSSTSESDIYHKQLDQCIPISNTVRCYESKSVHKKSNPRPKRRYKRTEKSSFKRNTYSVNYSGNSSDSTVLNIATNSSKEVLGLNRNIIQSCDSSSTKRANGNIIEDIKPVLQDQNQNSINVTYRDYDKSLTSKSESSHFSETEDHFSGNYYSESNNFANAGKLRCQKSISLFSKKRKQFTVNRTHEESENEIGIISINKKRSSDWLSNELKSIESNNGCANVNYDISSCYVALTREEEIDFMAKGIGKVSNWEKSTDSASQVKCNELDSMEQYKSLRITNISEKYKSEKNTKNNWKTSCENYVSKITKYKFNVHTDSGIHDNYTDKFQVFSDDSHPPTTSKKHVSCITEDSDDTLPSTGKTKDVSKNRNKCLAQKLNSKKNDVSTHNISRIVNSSDKSVKLLSLSRHVQKSSNDSDSSLADTIKIKDTSKRQSKKPARKLSTGSDDTVIEIGNRVVKESSNKSLYSPSHNKSSWKSDNSSDLPDIGKIINRSKYLQKMFAGEPSSESDNTVMPNGEREIKDSDTVALSDDNIEDGKRSNIITDTADNLSNNKYSSGNKECVKLSKVAIAHDSDSDNAYLADTDDPKKSEVKSHCVNYISEKNISGSPNLKANLLETANAGKSASRIKPPYFCTGIKTTCTKCSDSAFVFKSKTYGSKYIVEHFQHKNIEKVIVTIRPCKEKTDLSIKDLNARKKFLTVSEKISALGCFQEKNTRICGSSLGSCYLSSSTVDNDPNDCQNCAKSSDNVCMQPEPSCSYTSHLSDSIIFSDAGEFDNQCGHCSKKFVNRRENYYHICPGKLQKGFLCIYCEKIFSSYSKLSSHMKLHLMF